IGGIDHSGVSPEIHQPSLGLAAHKGNGDSGIPGAATLDQYLADAIGGDTPYRNLALSATGSTDVYQGVISFRDNGQAASTERDPRQLFRNLFAELDPSGGPDVVDQAALRRA